MSSSSIERSSRGARAVARRSAAIACAAIVGGLVVHAVQAVVHAALGDSRSAVAQRESRLAAREVPPRRVVLDSGDDWLAKLKTEKFWTEKRSGRAQSAYGAGISLLGAPSSPLSLTASRAGVEHQEGWTWYRGGGDTFRTVCVRLCDGYHWPVSFSTTSDNFERDQGICERSCSSPARLYVMQTPGGTIEDMEDVRGNPYRRLRTAFLYRTTFDEACKCKPHPWEQEAMDRHRLYAAAARRRKGDQVASTEFTRLKTSLEQAGKVPAAHRTLSVEATVPADADKFEKSARQGGAKPAGKPPRETGRTAAATPAAVMRLGATAPAPVRAERPARVASSDDWRKRSFEAR